MTIIYFVRHGMTDYSGKSLCGNKPGIHLNQTGRKQAKTIAFYLQNINIKSIYSSPLERAIETGKPTARQKSLSIAKVEFLREIDFGDYHGKESEELQHNALWNDFITKPTAIHFPNGETVSQAQNRVIQGLNDICQKLPDDGEILCVAHCEIIRLAIAYALNMTLDDYIRLTIDTGSISKVAWSKRHGRVLFLNHSPY